MALNVFKVNYALNVGEVSARFEARQDKTDKYPAACRLLDNWLPLTVGGVTRRPGWGFAAKAKFSGAANARVQLVDFRFSSTQAYTLEFGDLYVRFFKDGLPVMRATQAVTGITQASSAVVTYTGADSYVVGNKVTLTGVVGMVEINGIEGSITAVNTGANTFTLNIDSTGFTAYTSGGVVNTPFELVTPFPLTDIDLIKIGSFQSADVMYIATGIYPVQKLTRVALSPDRFTISPVAFNPPATIEDEPTGTELASGNLTLSALTGAGETATLANAVTLAGDVNRVIVSGAGRAIITGIGSSTVYNIDILDDFESSPILEADWRLEGFGDATMDPTRRNAGEATSLVASTATFRSTDAGKYMTLYGGLIKIATVTDSTHANGTILNTLRDVPNDPTTGLPFNDPPPSAVWTIEVPAWTAALGYPNCGCFFQSRMWLCQGQTVNGSVSGDFENFSKGSNADDAIQRTIDDDQVNPIRWIKGLRTLQAGTGGSAYEITASATGKALSPSDFTALPISTRGSAKIPPMKVGGQLIYVQFGQKKIRELVFDFVTDKYKSPSLFYLAEHLTEFQFVIDCAYQQEPDSVIWAVRDDGQLLALTYQEDENVIGWSQHTTRGQVQSCCVIPRPSTGKDWLWASIKRTINSVDETFIEFMEPDANVSREWKGLQTDCAKVTAPDANLLVTGAGHLEGETVKVIGDGMLFDDAVVTDGQFTVTPTVAVSEIEYGLPYISEGLTCEPPIVPQEGGMFMCRRWKNLQMRVRHVGPGLTMNVDDSDDIGLPVRRPDHPMGVALPLQEGKICTEQTNWNPFARVRFKQTLPFPCEVLNIGGDLEISTEQCCETVDENPEFGQLTDDQTIPNDNCPESTEPTGIQSLAVVHCYDYNVDNNSSQLNFVSGEPPEFVVSLGVTSGFPVPYSTAGTNPAMFAALDNTLSSTAVLPLGAPVSSASFTGQPAQAGSSGHSDEPSILFHMGSLTPNISGQSQAKVYFNYDTGAVSYLLYQSGTETGPWAKRGDRFWDLASQASGHTIERYSISLGGVPVAYGDLGLLVDKVKAFHATSNFLYMLYADDVTPKRIVYRLDLDTMVIVDQWDVTGLFVSTFQFFAASDDLIYIIAQVGTTLWRFGWLKPSTGIVSDLGIVARPLCIGSLSGFETNPGQVSFHYNNGDFFMGYGGFGTGVTNVVRIGTLVCPGTTTRIGSTHVRGFLVSPDQQFIVSPGDERIIG